MGWLNTLWIAALSAVAGMLGAGLLASVFVEWFRIPSREGASGYYVVGLALVGLVVGLVIGVVCARVVGARPEPSVLAAVGWALAVTAATLALVAGFGWLSADFPPTRDGRSLEVEVEVRLPPSVELPLPPDEAAYRWHVTITADTGARRQSLGPLELAGAARVDGRWVARAVVPLTTGAPGKTLGVGLGDLESQYLRLPLDARPSERDFEWSEWRPATFRGDLSPLAPEEAAAVRFRVRLGSERSR
jgi:hypothetical protein